MYPWLGVAFVVLGVIALYAIRFARWEDTSIPPGFTLLCAVPSAYAVDELEAKLKQAGIFCLLRSRDPAYSRGVLHIQPSYGVVLVYVPEASLPEAKRVLEGIKG